MKITTTLWAFFAIAGLPCFLLILWPVLFKSSASYQFYLLSVNLMTISSSAMNTITLFISTDIRKYLFNLIIH